MRRGGRVAEGARLESVYAGNRIAGSNPALSAILSPEWCRQLGGVRESILRSHMSYSTILVYVGGDLVGDGLIKLPFIYNLRQNNPNAKIVWCYGEFDSVFENLLAPLIKSQIDEVVSLKNLSSQNFDLIIDTQSEWLTTLKLKMQLTCTYFFSPTLGYFLSDFKPPKGYKAPKRLIDKMLGFLDIIGMDIKTSYVLDLDQEWQEKAAELLPGHKKYIGFAVGAGYRAKCWPRKSYQSLARQIKKEGYKPVIILGPQEQDWVTEFQQELPDALYPLQDKRVTKQSPLLTIALAQRFEAAVSNDCGVGHMVAAANTPLLTLFGPTTADKFAPKVLKGLTLRAQDFGGNTMESIPQQAVFEELKELL